MDNYDNLITDIFKNDIQIKRITKGNIIFHG